MLHATHTVTYIHSIYSHKNYISGNGKYEGDSSSFISGSFRIT